MEIVSYGCQPKIQIIIQSENYSELRDSLFKLDQLSRRKGYLTIRDIYITVDVACPAIAYSHLGWYGHTCFGNGPIGEKKRLCDDVTVFYYNLAPSIDLNEDEEITPDFKPALPKSAKDAKIQKAYNVLTRAYLRYDTDEDDLAEAMEEAIGYLGEVLE